jgi:hypothetical protein
LINILNANFRLFHKGRNTPTVGDEFEFDRHIVTIEAIEESSSSTAAVQSNTIVTAAAATASTTSIPSMQTTENIPVARTSINNNISQPMKSVSSASNAARNRSSNRAPGLSRKRVISLTEDMDVDPPPIQQQAVKPESSPPLPSIAEQHPQQVIQNTVPIPEVVEPVANPSDTVPNNLSNPTPIVKRFRVGLSKRPEKKLHANLQTEVSNNSVKKPTMHSPRSIHSFKPPMLNPSSTVTTLVEGTSFAPASTIRIEEERSNVDQSVIKPFKTPMAEGS